LKNFTFRRGGKCETTDWVMLNTSAGLYTTLPHALQQYIANKLKLNTALQVEFPPPPPPPPPRLRAEMKTNK